MGDRLDSRLEGVVVAALGVSDDLIGAPDTRDHQPVSLRLVFRPQRGDPLGFPDDRLEMIGDAAAETIAPFPWLDVRHVIEPSVYPFRESRKDRQPLDNLKLFCL